MDTLLRLLPVVCLPTLVGIAFGSATAADPPPSPDELLKEYRSLGLPLPSEKAKLVRYKGFGGGIVNGKVQPPGHGLAFELKAGTKSEKPLLLRGTDEWRPNWDPHTQEVKPDPTAAKDTKLTQDDALILAIQCQARGWDELAKHLLKASQKDAETSPNKQLVSLAWEHWIGQLTHPTADRGPVAKRLKELIRKEAELDTKYHRTLLKSLESALVPSKAKPGSLEALIDGLVDYHADSGTLGVFEPADAYWRIAELGFDAVPALIEHLGDDRLTRAKMIGFNNFRSWNMRVKDVVGDLLEGLAAEELMRGDNGEDAGGGWLRRQQGWPVTKAAASDWWKKAQKTGEEKYLLDRVLPPAPKSDRQASTNTHLLRVIVGKYPKNVAGLYKTVLEKRPELSSWDLAQTLAKSPAPAKEKLDLILFAAKHKDLQHRLPAFHALRELDKKEFDSLLLATIEGFATDVKVKYWTCPEAYIARLAVESDDPRLWATLEKVAKRSAIGLRMEILNHFGDSRDSRRRVERMRLLSAFLDDSEMRDAKVDERFEGPGAGFPYDRIEVRDFAAMKLARLLGIEVELKLDRTPEEWTKLRDKVQADLKQELTKMKE